MSKAHHIEIGCSQCSALPADGSGVLPIQGNGQFETNLPRHANFCLLVIRMENAKEHSI
jgi:hypothetical protein